MTCSITDEMSAILRAAAEPRQVDDSVKAAINRAAHRLGLSYRRAITLWYGRSNSIRAEEADRLRAVRSQLLGEQIARLEHQLAVFRAIQNDKAQIETGSLVGTAPRGSS